VVDIAPLKVFKINTKTGDYLRKRSCVCRRCAGRVIYKLGRKNNEIIGSQFELSYNMIVK